MATVCSIIVIVITVIMISFSAAIFSWLGGENNTFSSHLKSHFKVLNEGLQGQSFFLLVSAINKLGIWI